ncbi:MAG: hypothetical protein JNL28_12670 [Planctomycetes bacterium]|nr:hypothetical protein [Planctomycetota bacterium]
MSLRKKFPDFDVSPSPRAHLGGIPGSDAHTISLGEALDGSVGFVTG